MQSRIPDDSCKQSFDVNSFLAKTLSNFSESSEGPRSFEPRAKSLPPKPEIVFSRRSEQQNTSCTILNNISDINSDRIHTDVYNGPQSSGRLSLGRQERKPKRSHQNSSSNSKKRRTRRPEGFFAASRLSETLREAAKKLEASKKRVNHRPSLIRSSSGKRASNEVMGLNDPQNENSRLLRENGNVAILHNTPIAHSVSNQRLEQNMLTSSVMANVSSTVTPSVSKSSLVSATSSLRPLCRICQMSGGDEPNDQLISPCRCSGSMLYVHTSCLVHWLEISTRKMCPTPQCELCGYEYKTHHCLRLQKLHMPRCSQRDTILHVVFFIVLLVMLGCAALCVMYLKNDPGTKIRTSLDPDDIIVITCSVLFFCAFFVAVFTQYRAEASICRLFFRSWLINKHWRIRNYDPKDDWQRNDRLIQGSIKTDV